MTGLQSLAFRADTLATWAAHTGRADALAARRGSLGAVAPSSVTAAAKEWLAESASVVAIGRAKVMP